MVHRPNERSRVVHAALSVLQGKWRPQILLALHEAGPLGFNELEDRLEDISGKVLSENLEALQDEDVIERVVVEESPLRVEYELTDAGADLDVVFEALATWGERHVQRSRPCVLIADRDRRLTELYRHWLAPQYAIRHAHDRDELRRQLDDSVNVVVVDRSLPGGTDRSPGRLARSADDRCRVVTLTAERPDLEVVDVDCDAIVRKPTSRDTLRSAIETQLERYGQSPEEREYHALESCRAVLEDTYSDGVLEDDDRYARLQSRIEEARADLALDEGDETDEDTAVDETAT